MSRISIQGITAHNKKTGGLLRQFYINICIVHKLELPVHTERK